MGQKIDFVYLIATMPGRHSGDQVHKVKKNAAPLFLNLLLGANYTGDTQLKKLCTACAPTHTAARRSHTGTGGASGGPSKRAGAGARSPKGRGKPQMSHQEFVESLKHKVRARGRVCHEAFLPVHGKNRVLFSFPAPA